MNSIIKDYYPLFQNYQALRGQLMEILTDGDLAYRVAGDATPSLGGLCREIGDTEYSYIQSFKTFTQDFSYHNPDPQLERSVAALTSWYADLDRDLRAAIEAISEEDCAKRTIDRGGGFTVLPPVQIAIYNEALLIFYGKASIYLKGLRKPLPQQWQDWIG
ncbi:MAG TPA: hypothetical protein VF510_23200 [Ktedonobacterales bacterium]